MAKPIIYPSDGVLIRKDGFSDPRGIRGIDKDGNGQITVYWADPPNTIETLDVPDENIGEYDMGSLKFTTEDGTDYIARAIDESDGSWISEYGVQLPGQTLRKLMIRTSQGEDRNMPYLDDENERMLAFQVPDEDDIIGILYVNRYGAYIRSGASWVKVSKEDASFDNTIPFTVNKDTVDEFIDMFDAGPIPLEEAKNYISSPKD